MHYLEKLRRQLILLPKSPGNSYTWHQIDRSEFIQSQKSYKGRMRDAYWRKTLMKVVEVCDKLREADKQALYPKITEWGNPSRVMSAYLLTEYIGLKRVSLRIETS